ncbi:MAG: DUF4352 domain-containing protein [Actinomycetota bacterium]|nr:DUF4352 domain-containing protein [Actinomycetota bacterium]
MINKIVLMFGVVSILGALALTVVVWLAVAGAADEEIPASGVAQTTPTTPEPAPHEEPPVREAGREEPSEDANRMRRFREGVQRSQRQQEAAPQRRQAPAIPAASSDMASIGESVSLPSGLEVRVLSYTAPVRSEEDGEFLRWKPDAGKRFAAIDVRGCATGDDRVPFDGFEFSLTMPDDTRIASTLPTVSDPALQGTNLLPGECVRGFVNFQVPKGQRPAYVRFDRIFPDEVARWRVD